MENKNASPRILLWDIETLPNIVATFQLFDKYNSMINPDNLIRERIIVCAAWQWLGEKEIHAVSLLDDPKRFAKDNLDDTFVVNKLAEILRQADAVVHHNGNAFDLKWTETRMLAHGLDPLPPMHHLDTLATAKKRFYFNSNRLDYLGKFLKVGQKKETEKGLWIRALKGEKAAIKSMVEYNKGDITLLRNVFLKLRPYMDNYISLHAFGHNPHACPRCGSLKVKSEGIHHAPTQDYPKYQCGKCGGWYRSYKGHRTTKTRML